MIGVRVTAHTTDLLQLAMHLAGMALEQNVEIAVLSHLSYSGLGGCGFRSERVCGETPEELEACEEQLKRFWNIEMVI